jgi:hypothetical protein
VVESTAVETPRWRGGAEAAPPCSTDEASVLLVEASVLLVDATRLLLEASMDAFVL